ncbi:MAG: AI-2E family transporter [Devosia sp.]
MNKRQPAARSKRLQQEISNTQFERILGNAAQLSLVLVGGMVALVALHLGQVILAPVFLAITVGLMFGPVADALEKRGVPDGVSAAAIVLLFLGLIAGSAILFVAPLADWAERIPIIWEALRAELANWKEPLASIGALQEQIKGVLGAEDAALTVTVEEGSPVQNIAFFAPGLLAEVLVFLASLYFFLATRDQIRIFILSLCVTRRLRWRTAHVFRDVEAKVSKFLLAVSVINISMGIGVAILMALIGMPTPILWGALAAVLNFIPFVGQAVMVVLLFAVGLGTQNGLEGALLPVGLYLALNFVEGNFVTPNLIGRAMTMNPFLIFFAITYWLWAWGPVGGFIAVPSLLILYSVATNILPMRTVPLRREQRKLEARAIEEAKEATPKVAPPMKPQKVEMERPVRRGGRKRTAAVAR